MDRIYKILARINPLNSSKTPVPNPSKTLIPNNTSLNADRYKELFDKLDTLDIILFKGEDYWFSYVVEYLTWSEFSHIGIVLKSPTYISPELTGVYLLESGSENFPDAEDHKRKFGVQISDLTEILDNYTGKVYYRKLSKIPFYESFNSLLDLEYGYDDKQSEQEEFNKKLAQIYKDVYDKPYDDLIFDLLRTEVQLEVGDCRNDKRFFCSALTAYVYARLELLPTNIDWSLVMPKHFGEHQKVEKELRGTSLGPLVTIRLDTV